MSPSLTDQTNHSSMPAEPATCPAGVHVQAPSYRSKLVGCYPGAFENAFCLERGLLKDELDDDVKDDMESEKPDELWVLLSPEDKRNIRDPWRSSLIVKLFGEAMELHYFSQRLRSLWKPSAEMSCIDLGYGFFWWISRSLSPRVVWIEGHCQIIQYEGIDQICFQCCVIGHTQTRCQRFPEQQPNTEATLLLRTALIMKQQCRALDVGDQYKKKMLKGVIELRLSASMPNPPLRPETIHALHQPTLGDVEAGQDPPVVEYLLHVTAPREELLHGAPNLWRKAIGARINETALGQSIRAGTGEFHRTLLDLIQQPNPDIVILTEARLSRKRAQQIASTFPFDGFTSAPTRGHFGGIWMLWQSDRVNMELLQPMEREIHDIVHVSSSSFSSLLSSIYASPRLRERKILWDNLRTVAADSDLTWVVLGDFNEVCSTIERMGGNSYVHYCASLFNKMITVCGLDESGRNKILGFRNSVGEGSYDPMQIQEMIQSHFISLYTSSFTESKCNYPPEIEYDSNCEENATLSSKEDPSDDAFFVAEGNGEPDFDEDDERDDKGYDDNQKFDEFEGNDVGLFASAEYDEDDKEADAVWEGIDKRMDSRRKDRREARLKQEIEKYRGSNQQMRTRMSDVSIEPITTAEYFESEFFSIIRSEAWANIGFRSSMKDVYVCVDDFISGLLGRIRGRILSTHSRMMRQKTWQVISRNLVLRLRPFLRDIISPYQSNFIPGRKAGDNVIILRVVMKSFRTTLGNQGTFVLKLDLEKALDRLERSFIRKVLYYFGFPEKWIDMILSCISSTTMSIVFNGGCLESFKPSRGIWQGDPLSPYIFILCMEYLSNLIENEVDAGNWCDIKPFRGCFPISHLLFADDIILRGCTGNSSLTALEEILHTFYS
ncbi:hypothetical protein CRG98_037285 [Punica granatum]|uniref:Reverse transcriptase domain-containing protein n=1 Tax=Punica granatum TaxID=22663 RepID=A0A2I0IE80_PUNGR|nr:hypothetical protein CRG98_037285 [Punica granatum]